MKKFGMIFLAITLMLTGCGKDNKKESNTIIIENTSNKLSQEQANKYAKSIQTIIVETYIGINSIENFKVIFEDEKDKIDKINVTVESDWTVIRKPEENPVILGMKEEIKALKNEKEKQLAEEIMEGFLKEFEAEYQKTQRIKEKLVLEKKASEKEEYEIFYPEIIDGKSTLYPMKEYYDKNFKEDVEQRKELGHNTLLERLSLENVN